MRCRQKMHVYEVRPRKDKRGVDLISDALCPELSWLLVRRRDLAG